ncbi:LytR C-terminal domain-containing protein [Patescibacteria group bacterium]
MKRKSTRKERQVTFGQKRFFRVAALCLLLVGGVGWYFRRGSDLSERLNIVFGEDPVVLVSWDKKAQSLTFLNIPGQVSLKAKEGLGHYRLGAFARLEQQENNPRLGEESFWWHLGVPVQAWYPDDLSRPPGEDKRILKRRLLRQLFSVWQRGDWEELAPGTKWLSFGSALIGLWRQPLAEIEIYELKKGRELVAVSSNSEDQFEFDIEKTDQLFRETLFERQIKQENLSVGIANATSKPGLAKNVSRLVENLGGRVVDLTDWPQALQKSQLITTEAAKNSLTVKKLSSCFKTSSKQSESETFLVDVLLVIGEDVEKEMRE